MPESNQRNAVQEFFGAGADHYDKRHYQARRRSFISDRQELVSRVFRNLGVARDARVLDIACGPGHFLFEAVERGTKTVGIDASGDMLRTAANRLAGRARLVRGDGTVLPFASASYDVVNCSGFIEYLPEPMPLLREALRVLKPGGRAVISSTNRRSPAHLLAPLIEAVRRSAAVRASIRALRLPIHEISLQERRFKMAFHTPGGLADQLQGAGFADVEMHYYHLQLFPHPLEHLMPAVTTACVKLTDRLLGMRPLRGFAEGLLAVGRRAD